MPPAQVAWRWACSSLSLDHELSVGNRTSAVLGRRAAAECIQAHDLWCLGVLLTLVRRGGLSSLLRWWRSGFLGPGRCIIRGWRLSVTWKPKDVADIGIDEGGDGGQRDAQRRGDTAEGQANAHDARRLVHHQIPEFVLQDDRHLLWVLGAQPRRHYRPGVI